jgi:hypothetical protein
MQHPLKPTVFRLQLPGDGAAEHPRASEPAAASGRAIELDINQLFQQYAPYVAAVALRLLGRDDELEDLVQDVFVVALRDPQVSVLRAACVHTGIQTTPKGQSDTFA